MYLSVVEECTDFEVCSASCGGGTQTCSNTCLHGNFGDDGCPEGSKIRTQECNKQDCPGNITLYCSWWCLILYDYRFMKLKIKPLPLLIIY